MLVLAELERYETQILRYATEPFETDTEVVGPLALHLRLAANALDTHVVARVSDVSTDRRRRRTLSYGWLQASHRRVDRDRSGPAEILHDHGSARPFVPGEPVELDLSLTPTATLFRAGHRLLLEVGSRPDLLTATMFEDFVSDAHLAPPYPCRNTVHHGPAASWLEVPVRPARSAARPATDRPVRGRRPAPRRGASAPS